MTVKNYFLLSVGIFALVLAAVGYFPIPILPFALILLVGETLLGLQAEDHKVAHVLAELFKEPKHHAPPSKAKNP